MKTIYAKDINDALFYVAASKLEGFDWFRGQINSWPLIPSLVRLKDTEINEASIKSKMLLDWINKNPRTQKYMMDLDYVVAIAQHYGLPTTFIDFTTESTIAAFFASHGIHKDLGNADLNLSCIYCLHSKNTQKNIDAIKHVNPTHPRLVKINVDNLWRLEAQKGVFFDWPWAVEGIQDMLDKILYVIRIAFPYSGPVEYPLVEMIYPKRKSQLEIMLDGYFQEAQIILSLHQWEKTGGDILFPLDRNEIKGITQKAFTQYPPVLDSWLNESAKWKYDSTEKFKNATSDKKIQIIANRSLSLSQKIEQISKFINDTIVKNRLSRKRLITWEVRDQNNKAIRHYVDVRMAIDLSVICNEIWDGMRTLPYTNSNIAECIATTIALLSERSDKKIYNFFGDNITIEIGSLNGGHCQAIISRKDLQSSVRKDVLSFIRPEHHSRVDDNVEELLWVITDANRVFEFDKLVKLFPTIIIPTQFFLGGPNEPRFYSPAEIDILGLA